MKRAVWIPLVVLLALIAAVIAFLPVAGAYFAEDWLRQQGVPAPAIDDVDANLFTGVVRVEGLQFSGAAAGEQAELDLVEVDLDWLPLFSRQLEIVGLRVQGVRVDVSAQEDGGYRVGGLSVPLATTGEAEAAEPEPAAGDAGWGVAASNVTLADVNAHYRDQRFDSRVAVETATLDRIATWEGEVSSTLALRLRFDDVAIALAGSARPLAREPWADLSLQVDGLPVGRYAAAFEIPGVQEIAGTVWVDLETEGRLAEDGAVAAQIDGELKIDDAGALLTQGRVSNDRLQWRGAISARLPAGEAPLEVAGTSAVSAGGLLVEHPAKPIRLLALGGLEVEDVVVEAVDRVGLGRVSLSGLEVLRASDAAALVIADTEIVEVAYAGPAALQIASVRLGGLQGQLERRADGSLGLVSEVMADYAPAPAAEEGEEPPADTAEVDEPEPEEAAPLQLRIGKVEIGGDSAFGFQDETVSPPFGGTFALQEIRVEAIDNTDPEQPAHFVFDIARGEMRLVGEGDVWLFGEAPSSTVEVALERFDLTEVSPYLPGYDIRRGRLMLKTRGSLTAGELDVTNEVLIERLQMAGKADAGQAWLGQGMAMPLDVALDLLRDSNDRIELELPITGRLDDPQLDTADIMRTAMQGALQKAALSYAKNALQPLGTIMLVAKVAGQAARPRFDPVVFDPGSAVLGAAPREYLDKVAELLGKREGLQLTLCGVSPLADRDHFLAALQAAEEAAAAEPAAAQPAAPPETPEEPPPPPSFDAERLELARARGGAIQDYLSEAGIDSERLFRCMASLEENDDEPPRVEMTL